MSKLLSCFWKNKKKSDYCDEENVRRSRRLSNNQVLYLQTGTFLDKEAENILNYSGNVNKVFRTETGSQNPQFENLYESDGNRQSRSYPVSPERKLCKAYSFEQRPSLEKQRRVSRQDSRNSRSLMIYAGSVNPVVPRLGKTGDNSNDSFPVGIPINNVPIRSNLSHDSEYEVLGSKRSPRCVAEKPAEEDYEPDMAKDKPELPTPDQDKDRSIQAFEKLGNIRRGKTENENFSLRSSSLDNQSVVYVTDDTMTIPKIKTCSVVRVRPRSSKNYALGSSVKPMVYRADDATRSPMSGGKQISVRASKQPPLLTTDDGKVLRPLTSETARRLSTAKSRASQQIKFSVVRPPEVGEDFPLAHGAERASQQIKLSVVRPPEAVEDFPLAHGTEMMVAAPMIGGGGAGGMKKPQKTKSILRNPPRGGGNARPRGGPQTFDDYDDYPYEDEYGRGNYRQPYYDDDPDMYSYGYGAPTYYDDGYGYQDEYYGRGPPPGMARGGGRPPRQHAAIYAAQMPDITLPTTSVDKGKNPLIKKTGKPPTSDAQLTDTCIDKHYYELKSEKTENNQEQYPKEHKIKLISSAQQTDLSNDLDFICFSPERFLKTAETPDDPNSKLRWRIIIKRGDQE